MGGSGVQGGGVGWGRVGGGEAGEPASDHLVNVCLYITLSHLVIIIRSACLQGEKPAGWKGRRGSGRWLFSASLTLPRWPFQDPRLCGRVVLGLLLFPLLKEIEAVLPQDMGGDEDGGEGGDVWLQAAAQLLFQVVPLPPPHGQDIRHRLHPVKAPSHWLCRSLTWLRDTGGWFSLNDFPERVTY